LIVVMMAADNEPRQRRAKLTISFCGLGDVRLRNGAQNHFQSESPHSDFSANPNVQRAIRSPPIARSSAAALDR